MPSRKMPTVTPSRNAEGSLCENMQCAARSLQEIACRDPNDEFKWAHLNTSAILAMKPNPSAPTRMAELACVCAVLGAGAGADADVLADAESGAGAGADALASAPADAEQAGTGCHMSS